MKSKQEKVSMVCQELYPFLAAMFQKVLSHISSHLSSLVHPQPLYPAGSACLFCALSYSVSYSFWQWAPYKIPAAQAFDFVIVKVLTELAFHFWGRNTKPHIGMFDSECGEASCSIKGGEMHAVKIPRSVGQITDVWDWRTLALSQLVTVWEWGCWWEADRRGGHQPCSHHPHHIEELIISC